MTDPREALAAMTRELGRPELDLVILGEGNTSLRVDDDSFLVKASGFSFADATAESFVQVRFAPVLALLAEDNVDEARLQAMYQAAKVDPTDRRRPSVETVFHAALLSLPGITAVAHTHATAVNGLTCAYRWREAFAGRIFPDEAVVLGPETVLVDYIDPGALLGRRLRDAVAAYRDRRGAPPKLVVMQNHGMIALGGSPAECINISLMAVKAARIRAQAMAAGGIRVLGDAVTDHLLGRPDERYRQGLLTGRR
jgi:rhamnose utilization protein RhaD (predicted bifunctional aldolase and dehydrogenase)